MPWALTRVPCVQDPQKRATADQILHHPWMKENGTATDVPLDNVILSRMRAFAGMNKLKKEALRIIALGISPEEIAGLRSIFQASSRVLSVPQASVCASIPLLTQPGRRVHAAACTGAMHKA